MAGGATCLTVHSPVRCVVPVCPASIRRLSSEPKHQVLSQRRARKGKTAAQRRAEDIAMFARMRNPEIAKLGRYLYFKPPWLVPPPPISFDPSIDMRRLGRPKMEQDKQERALCRAWKKVEGRTRAKKLRAEMELAFEEELMKALDRIAELSEEIGALKVKTDLGRLAIEADEVEVGGEAVRDWCVLPELSPRLPRLIITLQTEDNV
ncbi:hypothetical protein JCM10049v2_000724 [Rhodotorula toruloides]